jgi:hypothetical protein
MRDAEVMERKNEKPRVRKNRKVKSQERITNNRNESTCMFNFPLTSWASSSLINWDLTKSAFSFLF